MSLNHMAECQDVKLNMVRYFATKSLAWFLLVGGEAEAIRTTVVPIRILIRTTVVPITPLIGTTVVRIRILIGTTGI